jgi:hypothetical protein
LEYQGRNESMILEWIVGRLMWELKMDGRTFGLLSIRCVDISNFEPSVLLSEN